MCKYSNQFNLEQWAFENELPLFWYTLYTVHISLWSGLKWSLENTRGLTLSWSWKWNILMQTPCGVSGGCSQVGQLSLIPTGSTEKVEKLHNFGPCCPAPVATCIPFEQLFIYLPYRNFFLPSTMHFRDSMTHLQALKISMKFHLQMASDLRIVWKFLNSTTDREENIYETEVTQLLFIFFICIGCNSDAVRRRYLIFNSCCISTMNSIS